VFTGFRDCIYTEHIDVFGDFVQWAHPEAAGSQVVIGADWAKTVDYTVFIAVDVATRKVVGFMRFHKRPYTEAIKNLVRFTKNFKEVLCIYHDKTGVGMAIDDQLAYTALPFTGVTFSNSSKSQMVTNLMTAFEQKQIFIPLWQTLLSEIESFEVTAGAMGVMHYAAAQGGHDDTIAALMLANAALGYYGNISLEVSYADEGSGKLTDLERYYQDLED
jgi:phage FluMu gp28-like protein